MEEGAYRASYMEKMMRVYQSIFIYAPQVSRPANYTFEQTVFKECIPRSPQYILQQIYMIALQSTASFFRLRSQ